MGTRFVSHQVSNLLLKGQWRNSVWCIFRPTRLGLIIINVTVIDDILVIILQKRTEILRWCWPGRRLAGWFQRRTKHLPLVLLEVLLLLLAALLRSTTAAATSSNLLLLPRSTTAAAAASSFTKKYYCYCCCNRCEFCRWCLYRQFYCFRYFITTRCQAVRFRHQYAGRRSVFGTLAWHNSSSGRGDWRSLHTKSLYTGTSSRISIYTQSLYTGTILRIDVHTQSVCTVTSSHTDIISVSAFSVGRVWNAGHGLQLPSLGQAVSLHLQLTSLFIVYICTIITSTLKHWNSVKIYEHVTLRLRRLV